MHKVVETGASCQTRRLSEGLYLSILSFVLNVQLHKFVIIVLHSIIVYCLDLVGKLI